MSKAAKTMDPIVDPIHMGALAEQLEKALKGEIDLAGFMGENGGYILAAISAKAVPEWPAVTKLREPAEVLGETYHEFEMREPTIDEYLKAGFFDGTYTGDKILDLMCTCSGKSPPIIKRLLGFDLARTMKRIMVFFAAAAA